MIHLSMEKNEIDWPRIYDFKNFNPRLKLTSTFAYTCKKLFWPIFIRKRRNLQEFQNAISII